MSKILYFLFILLFLTPFVHSEGEADRIYNSESVDITLNITGGINIIPKGRGFYLRDKLINKQHGQRFYQTN